MGLGSFIVNAQADCNGCHTAGGPPNFNYANNGNPYFLNPPLGTKTDPTTYLAGGTPFGQAVPSSASVGGFPSGSIPSSYPPDGYPIDPTTGFPYAGPVIISRNLTPDKNGRPEGGRTLEEFKEILRNGTDFDKIHPTCESDTDPNIALGICVPPPVDGSKLQVMPWPLLHSMTDHQIEAIYEYLSTIPCIDNTSSTPPAGAPNELRNDCGIHCSVATTPPWLTQMCAQRPEDSNVFAVRRGRDDGTNRAARSIVVGVFPCPRC